VKFWSCLVIHPSTSRKHKNIFLVKHEKCGQIADIKFIQPNNYLKSTDVIWEKMCY